MTTPLLKAPNQLEVKIETTAGTDASPGVTNCVYAMDSALTINQGKEEMNNVIGGLGKPRPVFTGRDGTFSFSQYLKGSGTAGTAPELSAGMQMAGFTETDVGTTRTNYILESTRSSMKTATVKRIFGEVGTLNAMYKTLRGCMAKAIFTCKPGKAGTVAFDGAGAYSDYGDIAMPVPTFESTNPPTVGSMTGKLLKYHSTRVTAVDGAVEKLRDGAASNIKLAIKIVNSAECKLDRIQFYGIKVGTPANETNGVWVTIEGDAPNEPDGTPITNGTSAYKATTAFDTTGELVSFTFATPPTLAASTTYWAVIQGDYDVDASNCISFDTDAVDAGDQICMYYDAAWAALGLKNLTCNVLIQVSSTAAIYLDGFVIDTGAAVTLKKDWNAADGNERAEINSFADFNVQVEPLTTLKATRDWIAELRGTSLYYLYAVVGSTAGNVIDIHCHDLYLDEDGEEGDREGRLMETLTFRSEQPNGKFIINFR